MKKSVLVALVCATIVSGCKQEMVLKGIDARVDRDVGKTERQLMVNDVQNLMGYDLKVEKTSYFDKIFSGTDTASVLRYLDQRVKYFIPKEAKLDDRLVAVKPADDSSTDNKVYTIATNVGTVMWMIREASLPQQDVKFKFGRKLIALNDSRVGIIQLGEGYSLPKLMNTVSRQSTLVHEARHSDCTGGLSRDNLALIAKGTIPDDKSCGHLHAICPADHPYAGYAACDDLPWGAYAVEGVYTAAVAKACTNCSETDKQAALASTMDSLSRVLVLDDMLSGKLGDPDMSSTGVRE